MDQAEGLRNLLARPHPERLRVIAVTSGKGGVGKTNFSANLSVLAARSGRRVLVIDADLGLANVELLFGLTPRLHVGHVLDGTHEIDDVLATGPHGIQVLPAGSGLRGLTQLDDAQKLRLVSALESLENRFDLVVVDTGAGIGDNVTFFVGAAQEAVLVVNPEPTALTDAYAMLKVLSQTTGLRRFHVLVNPAGNDPLAHDVFSKLVRVAGRFLDANLHYLGRLPRDENLHRAVMAQRPYVDLYPQSPASRAMTQVAHRLLEQAPPDQLDGGMKLLWQRLFRESGAQPA